MKRLNIILFALTITCPLIGQVPTTFGFQEGTIIKKDSSIIACYVEHAIAYHSRVFYKMTEDGKKLSMKRDEIKSIRTPYSYIENIKLGDNERLMGLVSDGKIKLFSHVTMHSGRTQQGQGGAYSFNLSPTLIYVVKVDEDYKELKNKDFKQILSNLMSDQPKLSEKIDKGEFKFEDIEKIFKEYKATFKISSPSRDITIRVVDSETKKPVKEARIAIRRTNNESITNFLGFTKITAGALDTLTVTHPEYEMGFVNIPETNSFQIYLTKVNVRKD